MSNEYDSDAVITTPPVKCGVVITDKVPAFGQG